MRLEANNFDARVKADKIGEQTQPEQYYSANFLAEHSDSLDQKENKIFDKERARRREQLESIKIRRITQVAQLEKIFEEKKSAFTN